MKGVQNHARDLIVRKSTIAVTIRKHPKAVAAAQRDGRYFQRKVSVPLTGLSSGILSGYAVVVSVRDGS
jgi:hypothetical protein